MTLRAEPTPYCQSKLFAANIAVPLNGKARCSMSQLRRSRLRRDSASIAAYKNALRWRAFLYALYGGRCKDRTCDFDRVKVALYR